MTMSVLAVREAAEGDGTGAGARAREARVFAKGSFEAIAARCAPPPPRAFSLFSLSVQLWRGKTTQHPSHFTHS